MSVIFVIFLGILEQCSFHKGIIHLNLYTGSHMKTSLINKCIYIRNIVTVGVFPLYNLKLNRNLLYLSQSNVTTVGCSIEALYIYTMFQEKRKTIQITFNGERKQRKLFI